MSHTKMLHTRRRKQRGKKDIAGAIKRAKKLRKQSTKKAGAPANRKEPD